MPDIDWTNVIAAVAIVLGLHAFLPNMDTNIILNLVLVGVLAGVLDIVRS